MADNTTKDKLIRRRMFIGTLSNYAGQIFNMGIWFLLTPFILSQLGAADYGLWLLVGSVVAYGQLLDLGITSAVIKYVPEFMARKEVEQVQKLIATALRIYTGLGLFAFVCCLILAPFFPDMFNVGSGERNNAIWLVILMGFTLGVEIPGMTAYSVLRGLHRYSVVNFLNILGTFLTAAATVIVLLLGGKLLLMIALNIPITIIMQWVAIRCIKRITPEIKFGWRGASREFVSSILKFSTSIFIQNMGGRFQTKTDEIVIGVLLPISFITPYSLARRLSEIPRLLTDQFIKVLLPLASELHAENDLMRLRKLYISSTRLTLTVFLPIGCTVVILGREILTLWVGPAYADAAPLIAILTLAGFIVISQWPASSILQGIAKHRFLAFTSLGSGIVNLGLSIILVQLYGITGVALGTLIPTAIECLFLVLPYALHVLGVSPNEVLKGILLPAILPAIPLGIILYLLEQTIPPTSLFSLIVVVGIGGFIYIVSYFSLGINKTERRIYRRFVHSTIQTIAFRSKRF